VDTILDFSLFTRDNLNICQTTFDLCVDLLLHVRIVVGFDIL